MPDYDDRCTTFDKMLLVRCIREDRTLLCVDTYISETLGQRYIGSRPLDLRAVEEASALTPIVALLSQGADPTAPIMELARKKKKAIKAISMGQGQEPAARKLIAAGVTAGSWVLLQNCHLGLRFVSELERSLHGFEEIQPDFRLWVTTEPHPKFPIGLLQMSIKITNEAPAGVRAGLKASYNTTITQDTLDAVSMPQWKSMLYALAFMHTIVQERRKFGPLGFNIPYEFNTSDLQASMTFMQNHLNDVEGKKRPVDWVTVNYMVCDVQYGGRITDDWDRRLFNTYGQAWLAPRILEGGFEFYPGYRVAPGTDSDGYKKFVEGLPLIDDPGLFGLHSNADLVFRTAQTADVLGTVLDIQPKEGGGGGARRARSWCWRRWRS